MRPRRRRPERPERFAPAPRARARARLGGAGGGALPARPAARRRLERQPAERRPRGHRHPRWRRWAGSRMPGDPRTRAAAGCALVGGGVLALAWLPSASLWWTVIPQALAGVGMGLALTALGGDLLPERTPRDAARLLAVRHAGIAAILAIAAPIAAHQLDVTTQTRQGARRRARARRAAAAPGQDQARPRAAGGRRLRPAARRAAARDRRRAPRPSPGASAPPTTSLGQRADDMLVTAVGEAFRSSFLLARRRRPAGRGAAGRRRAAGGHGRRRRAGLGTPVAYFALHRAIAPAPPAILDPCHGQPHAARRRAG